jgi:hypothetical protein
LSKNETRSRTPTGLPEVPLRLSQDTKLPLGRKWGFNAQFEEYSEQDLLAFNERIKLLTGKLNDFFTELPEKIPKNTEWISGDLEIKFTSASPYQPWILNY